MESISTQCLCRLGHLGLLDVPHKVPFNCYAWLNNSLSFLLLPYHTQQVWHYSQMKTSRKTLLWEKGILHSLSVRQLQDMKRVTVNLPQFPFSFNLHNHLTPSPASAAVSQLLSCPPVQRERTVSTCNFRIYHIIIWMPLHLSTGWQPTGVK